MPKTYCVTNDYGETVRVIPDVIDPVQLLGVATTSGSHVVTVLDATVLWPGMAVQIPHIPRGAFIHAILSETEIVLMAPKWDAATGIASVSTTNAQATVTEADMLGTATGCSDVAIPTWYFEGTWQNVISSSGAIKIPMVYGVAAMDQSTTLQQQPWTMIPQMAVGSGGVAAVSAVEVVKSDSLLTTPLKRHDGEPWGVWLVTDNDGHQTKVRANPQHTIGPMATDAGSDEEALLP